MSDKGEKADMILLAVFVLIVALFVLTGCKERKFVGDASLGCLSVKFIPYPAFKSGR